MRTSRGVTRVEEHSPTGKLALYAPYSYTLSKTTTLREDGTASGERNIARLGEVERGRACSISVIARFITFSYQFRQHTAATDSSRGGPVQRYIGIEKCDGANKNARSSRSVIGKSASVATTTSDVAIVRGWIKLSTR